MKNDGRWIIFIFTAVSGALGSFLFSTCVQIARNRPKELRLTAALANQDETEIVNVTPLYAYIRDYLYNAPNRNYSTWKYEYEVVGKYFFQGEEYSIRLPFTFIKAQLSALPGFKGPIFDAASSESILVSAIHPSEWRISTPARGWKTLPPGNTTTYRRMNEMLRRIDTAQTLSEAPPIVRVKILKSDPGVNELKYWGITKREDIIAVIVFVPVILFCTLFFLATLPFSKPENRAIVVIFYLLVTVSRPVLRRIGNFLGKVGDRITLRTEFQYKEGVLRPMTEVERNGQ